MERNASALLWILGCCVLLVACGSGDGGGDSAGSGPDSGAASSNDGTKKDDPQKDEPGGADSSEPQAGDDGGGKPSPGGKADFNPPPEAIQHALKQSQDLVQSSWVAFNEGNYNKVVKRMRTALSVLERFEGIIEEPQLRFDARWLDLLARFRKNEEVDLAASVRELVADFPGRMTADQYRTIGSDLAYTQSFEQAAQILREGAGRFPAAAGELEEYATLVDRIATTLASYTGPEATIDANYRAFLERTRPKTVKKMREYALRAQSMKVHDKALLAIHDALAKLANNPAAVDASEDDTETPLSPPGDDVAARAEGTRYLLRFNAILSWVALGSFDTARADFDALAAEPGSKADWIAYLQIGMAMGEAGGSEAARSILEAGKSRFPAHSADFDRELSAL